MIMTGTLIRRTAGMEQVEQGGGMNGYAGVGRGRIVAVIIRYASCSSVLCTLCLHEGFGGSGFDVTDGCDLLFLCRPGKRIHSSN